jgi:beta-glucosidase
MTDFLRYWKTVVLVFMVAFWASCKSKTVFQYPFQNPKLSIEQRVDNLVAQLTLEEKIGQMVNNAPAITRLNVPAYNWWNEALHGVARSPYHVTSYPQAIGMAATWNTDALHTMADFCATEGRAIFNDSQRKGKTGIYLGLTYWSPNINIFRDPRWGRGQETYGEDPYLTGTLGKAFVRGLEGNHPTYLKASACAKHFAVHSGPEWNRSTFNAKVSDFDLWNTYLPAFKDLIVDAKVSGVMCAYNAIDGQPCCGNDRLMNDILRNKWHFEGYVTSDCGGIGHFWRTHKTHPSKETAAAAAVLHGTDCECSGQPTYKALTKALGDNLLSEADINRSVKRLFTTRFRLGMFDPKDKNPFSKIDISALEAPEHKAHALKMAQEAMVLLKNENNTLPLSKNIRKIAILGPNANDKSVLLGNYYGYPSEVTTVLEAIKQKTKAEIIFEKGVNLTDNQVFVSNYNEKLIHNNEKQGFKAEYFGNQKLNGAVIFTQQTPKIDFQWGDGETVAPNIMARDVSIRWSATFTPEKTGDITFELKGDDGARLFIDGKKCIETDLKNGYYTLAAEQGKNYQLSIEYWQSNDNAEVKFDMGFVEKTTPDAIAERVKDADAIVFVGGISAKLEGENMSVKIEGFKEGDRTDIKLPTVQTALLKALYATGKPVVFVNMSGSAIGFEAEAAQLPAILQAWYAGQSGGQAVADVLFGDYNPAGRLPITFYKNTDDLPDFENYSMENRTYRYYKGTPLYPFGFGLSYTDFAYSNLNIEKTKSNIYRVSATVKNIGQRDGDEVVQLYVSQKKDDTNTAIRALKGFKRINLKAGTSKKITFDLGDNELSTVSENGEKIPMQGNIGISVGGQQPNNLQVSNKFIQTIITKK